MRQDPRLRRVLGNLVTLGLLALWYVLLAPASIGGPAAYVQVSGHSMDGTYETGDLIVQRAQQTYEVGDVVTFRVGAGQVIHRIVGGNGVDGYVTRGDNNAEVDPWRPTDAEIVGRSWVRLPGSAWVLELPREPLFAGLAAGLGTLLVLINDERPRSRRASIEQALPCAEPAGTAS